MDAAVWAILLAWSTSLSFVSLIHVWYVLLFQHPRDLISQSLRPATVAVVAPQCTSYVCYRRKGSVLIWPAGLWWDSWKKGAVGEACFTWWDCRMSHMVQALQTWVPEQLMITSMPCPKGSVLLILRWMVMYHSSDWAVRLGVMSWMHKCLVGLKPSWSTMNSSVQRRLKWGHGQGCP